MLKTIQQLSVFSLLLVLIACQQQPPIDFSTQVKPILNKRCISCHGGVRKKAGFSILFEDEAKAQLESGAFAIVPGDPSNSEMIRRLGLSDPEERMPYHKEKLPQEEIDMVTSWIKEGAQWGNHWAYEPVNEPNVPKLPGVASPIDQFIRSKLDVVELPPSAPAPPHVLARRVALDIIGFPAPDSLSDIYLSDPTLENYETFVSKLLDSPHFGEKWASMWLDLARYADTKGYERDPDRQIWRYRDWLINAFNEDMPYDEFLTQQLAGDLLPNPTEEQYVATAFHRNTMTNDEGGTDNEEFRTAAVLDRVNTTWETLMGTTFSCVQCHTHPYDPFVHEEYYQFAAFFNNTRDEDTNADYPLLRHYDDDQQEVLHEITAWVEDHTTPEEAAEITRFVQTLSPARNSLTTDEFINAELADTKWLAFRNHASARLAKVSLTGNDRLLMRYRAMESKGILQLRLDSPKGEIIGKMGVKAKKGRYWTYDEIAITPMDGVHDIYFTYEHPDRSNSIRKHMMFDWFYFTKALPGESERNYDEVYKKYNQLIQANVPTTPVMIENPDNLDRETRVFERGSWTSKGELVQPGVPASLSVFPDDAPANELGLAKWMIDPQNPLTSRTITNRIWEQLFGDGLVETLEDLGTQGDIPVHQDLLDYLSWNMMHTYEWSIKTLIKEIVLSQTYQQSSVVLPVHLERDSDNRYLSRMNRVRLSAEQIRDQALVISGAYNPEMYGPPVKPYQPDGVWSSPYDGSKWIASKGDQQYRRAIYTYWKRTSPYPSMITFDGVGREICSSRRITTNTPLQALVTLNDSVYFDLSKKLARRVAHGDSAEKQIEHAYQQATGHTIDATSFDALLALYYQSLDAFKEHPEDAQKVAGHQEDNYIELAAMSMVANSIINLDEVVMKN